MVGSSDWLMDGFMVGIIKGLMDGVFIH